MIALVSWASLVEPLVKGSSEDPNPWGRGCQSLHALRAGDDIQEKDSLLLTSRTQENNDSDDGDSDGDGGDSGCHNDDNHDDDNADGNDDDSYHDGNNGFHFDFNVSEFGLTTTMMISTWISMLIPMSPSISISKKNFGVDFDFDVGFDVNLQLQEQMDER